jgi:GMP synthase (glutamine-hydrolysing)
MNKFTDGVIREIREQVGSERVLLALSGGLDSSVCAALLARAVPGQLTCIFVDTGLMRLNEPDEVEAAFSGKDLEFIRVDAAERFLGALAGVEDPEEKRKIIGAEFIRVFEEEARKLGHIPFLAQGTIYPDIAESGDATGKGLVKSHHNVGGLPADMGFTGLVEPLKTLYKGDVRKLAKFLELPPAIVNRQPFPGPGLAVRVIGEITREKLDILRNADAIFREEVSFLHQKPAQYFAVITQSRAVGTRKGVRNYEYVIALRAVNTKDFMIGGVAKISMTKLARIAERIIRETPGAGRVVYDITPKPPGTIEWE